MIERLRADKAFRDAFVEKTMRESISKQVKELRAWKGWTQTDLAQRISTKASCIARIENPRSKSAPRLSTLMKIAAAFDVALLIKFASWSVFLAVMAEDIMWLDSETEIQRLIEWAENETPQDAA